MSVIDNIGYIICESNIVGMTETNILKENNGRVIAEGVLQTANEKNRNGRFYSSEELFPQLTSARILELLEAGYLRAELGHPLSNELVRQQTIDDSRTCAQFLKLWTEGDNVCAHFRGTNNEFGTVFDKDLRDGCKPAWSLRALGTVANTERGAEVRNLKIITWDQVIYPSHPGAYTHKVITESAMSMNDMIQEANKERMIPITNESVLSIIKNESGIVNNLDDLFGLSNNGSFFFDPKTNRITTITESGDRVVSSIESYISKEIMEYASDMKYIMN